MIDEKAINNIKKAIDNLFKNEKFMNGLKDIFVQWLLYKEPITDEKLDFIMDSIKND